MQVTAISPEDADNEKEVQEGGSGEVVPSIGLLAPSISGLSSRPFDDKVGKDNIGGGGGEEEEEEEEEKSLPRTFSLVMEHEKLFLRQQRELDELNQRLHKKEEEYKRQEERSRRPNRKDVKRIREAARGSTEEETRGGGKIRARA